MCASARTWPRAARRPAAALRWLAAALLCLAAATPASALTVLYSASLNGNLDGCECKGTPRAGLAARAAWLKNYPLREAALVVDAGDILAADPDPELACEVLEAYAELGYDAVAVGDQEFSCGVPLLASWRGRFPLRAHNLVLCQEDRCIYFDQEPLVLDKGGEKVGLLALLDPQVFALYPVKLRDSLKVAPPAQAAAPLVSALRARAVDWVVVLYHGRIEEAERLARQVPGIDLLVVGHEQRLVEPRRVNGALLVSPGEEGNRLGLLTLRRDARQRVRSTHEFRYFRFQLDPRDPDILARLERYRQKLRDALKQSN
jgi:2',3'-cyclic-nucleotide 2'-phosphodiesterase (5'-nucleotidase family)